MVMVLLPVAAMDASMNFCLRSRGWGFFLIFMRFGSWKVFTMRITFSTSIM